jgi:hypothetical protein
MHLVLNWPDFAASVEEPELVLYNDDHSRVVIPDWEFSHPGGMCIDLEGKTFWNDDTLSPGINVYVLDEDLHKEED